MSSLRQRLESYEPKSLRALCPRAPEWRARGARVAGYIDFTSGLLTANVGHDNRRVRRAVARSRGWNGWYAPNRHRLAAYEALRLILPEYLDTYLMFSTGSEAIDCALKIADDNGYQIVTDKRSYHGSTIGAQWAGRLNIGDFSYFEMGPYPLEGLRWRSKAAVLLETFLGPWCEWYSAELVDELRRRQVEGTAIVIFDEMQAGFGRTGRWFGFEHYHIKPDIVVGGKAAGGGFPVAFVAGRRALLETNPAADYVSTFSACAPACAALTATVREVRRLKLIERVRANEWRIYEPIKEMVAEHLAAGFAGRGYAYAIDLKNIDLARTVVVESFGRGLLLLDTGRGTIKIAPPLCISYRDLMRGMEIIRESIERIRKK